MYKAPVHTHICKKYYILLMGITFGSFVAAVNEYSCSLCIKSCNDVMHIFAIAFHSWGWPPSINMK